MKKSLFGKNIPVNCSYCEYNGIENDIMFCKKSKQVKDGKCRSSSMTHCCVCRMSRFLRQIFRLRILNFNPPYFYYTGMNFVNIPFQN